MQKPPPRLSAKFVGARGGAALEQPLRLSAVERDRVDRSVLVSHAHHEDGLTVVPGRHDGIVNRGLSHRSLAAAR